jgi:hypothetical protein
MMPQQQVSWAASGINMGDMLYNAGVFLTCCIQLL